MIHIYAMRYVQCSGNGDEIPEHKIVRIESNELESLLKNGWHIISGSIQNEV